MNVLHLLQGFVTEHAILILLKSTLKSIYNIKICLPVVDKYQGDIL